MKKETTQEKREKNVKNFIAKFKFLSNPKYYKDIKVSWAAWDSWAARGQAGGCDTCNAKYHFAGFQHKRFTTRSKNKPKEYHWNDWGDLCEKCYAEVEKQCNYKFIKF